MHDQYPHPLKAGAYAATVKAMVPVIQEPKTPAASSAQNQQASPIKKKHISAYPAQSAMVMAAEPPQK